MEAFAEKIAPVQPAKPAYLKDVIFDGTFKHPVKGYTLNVTPEWRKKLAERFAEMSANGVKIPIYTTHKGGTANTLGYVTAIVNGDSEQAKALESRRACPVCGCLNCNCLDASRALDPSTMYAVFEFADFEAEQVARRVQQVSLNISPDVKDGLGNKYGEAIDHIAITPEPVIPGQGEFQRLAFSLSRETENRSFVQLTVTDVEHLESEGVVSMAKEEKKEDGEAIGGKHFEMCRAHLSKCLGAEHEDVKGLKPENAVPTVCKHLASFHEAHQTLQKAHESLGKAFDDHKKIAASMEDENKALKAKSLSAEATAPSARELRMTAKAANTELDALCTAGCVTPKVRDGLALLLVGKDGAHNAVALSCDDKDENLVGRICAILKDNTPVELGEKTKSQATALSREVPGGDAAKSAEQQKQVTNSMTEMANKGR